jgi:trehalose 6-phosphate phosphatase
MNTTSPIELAALLDPLREHPDSTAILCDVDGTLAPIVADPADSTVPESTRGALRDAARRFRVVACVTGRAALEARFMVGVEELTYVGNHGLERLAPGSTEVEVDPALGDAVEAARALVGELPALELAQLGLRVEDKGPIQAFHWRGAPDEGEAEARARELAAEAERAGLVPRWGRKVLELRPVADVDKGSSTVALLRSVGARNAVFGGDDLTDLDAFRELRRLRERGELDATVCVGVASDEAPDRLWEESDAIVSGTEGFAWVLRTLAGAPGADLGR